jgi:4-diphosphocytidyl-2-C-methyl-D-erythritol kinase
MNYLEIKAPAKINFGLNVISKRDDGFHNIKTIFYPLRDLYDVLTFRLSDKFRFKCSNNDLADNQNLIIKAKELLEDVSKRKFNVEINLDKRIPIGAGLGGGSSDAAATLLSLNEMFILNLESDKLKEFGLQLGSDVPFFISCKPSFAEGRGEKISQIDFEIKYPILVVNPGIHISTKEAYRNISPDEVSFSLSNFDKINFNDSEKLKLITNDFEKFVFKKYPAIKNIKEQLYNKGAKFALMTGSGSTVFGIFEHLSEAQIVKESFSSQYFTFISEQ